MGKVLVIAEKPSVGQDIAKVLGCKIKKAGYFVGETHIVTWAIGHLVSLAEPEDYDPALKKWSLNTLPIIPQKVKLKNILKTKKQFEVINELINSSEVDYLVCATDAGREGELIFRYIYHMSGCSKPFKRLWISSMTDEAIKKGFANLKDGQEYDNLYLSARCRSEADWLVGINATRAFTVRQGALLSIGRVQTPTLALIVKRQQEIEAFQAQEYWQVKAIYAEGFSGLWHGTDQNNSKISSREIAESISSKVNGKTGLITDIQQESKRELPPQLYDLTSLQRDANKTHGFSAKKTLELCQKLYETHKVITYPRTDSRYLSDDIAPQLKGLLFRLNQEPYQSFVQELIKLDKLPVTKRIVDNSKVSDHHAIIPTGKPWSKLNQDELKVFSLVATRFIAAFFPPFEYEITTGVVEIEKETFISKGKVILKEGWKALYSKNEEQEQALPVIAVGQQLRVGQVEIEEKKTQPPKPYTEAGLLSAMENAGRLVEDEDIKDALKEGGLGTPATRAGIIERLIQVGYIERKGKALIPTFKGRKLIEIVPEQLKSPETTGKWEKGLNVMVKGQMEPNRFMDSIKRYVHFLVEEASKTPVYANLKDK